MEKITVENKTLRPYTPVLKQEKRYYLLGGGRSAGRSYFASQFVKTKLISNEYFRCAIMRYVLTDIRNSIFQEIIDRLEEEEIRDIVDVREHTLTINFKKNTINGVGFRKSSGDQKSKLKSLANYNCVVIEEADEVSEEDFQQLDDSLRTVKGNIIVILLFNFPDKNHWIIKRWFNLIDSGVEGYYIPQLKESQKDSTEFIYTTFENNIKNINQTTIDNFNNYKETKPDHYYSMIKGYVSYGKKGIIFKNWQPISNKQYDELDIVPIYGMDFGFTNDPTSLFEVKIHNQNIYVKQLIYETGLLNSHISQKMKSLGIPSSRPIYADSQEPKSIQEIKLSGFNCLPAEKGQDSIRKGIDLLLTYNVYYTEDSTDLAEEIQNYVWALDKNKEPTNEPIDDFNHAIDAIRYAVYTSKYLARPNIRLL